MRISPRIGLLAGDPSGIGPEVAAKLLATPESRQRARFVLIGDREVFRAGANVAGVPETIAEDFPCVERRLGVVVPLAQVSREAGMDARDAAARGRSDSARRSGCAGLCAAE